MMGMFDNVVNKAKSMASGLSDEADKMMNMSLLNGCCGAAVMVSMADGDISSDEKSKAIMMITNNDRLSVFSKVDVLTSFNSFVASYGVDTDLGEEKVLMALDKIKDNDYSSTAIRLAITVGDADLGGRGNKENVAINKMCMALGKTSADFGIY